MAWRAFADVETTEGIHVIFTNDGRLDSATILNPYSGEFRRFGKIAKVKTQAELEQWCATELAKLEGEVTSDITLKTFVTPTVVAPIVDPKQEAAIAVREALKAFEVAERVQAADPTYDISKYKQAVADAQTALDAIK